MTVSSIVHAGRYCPPTWRVSFSDESDGLCADDETRFSSSEQGLLLGREVQPLDRKIGRF